jgi:hypothetical protein
MLPDLIEIVPPSCLTDATVVLPGSKSLTNRALILAALASNPVVLRGALWSEDTQAMVNCLKRLGFCIEVADDPAEPANCTLTVYGCGGRIRRRSCSLPRQSSERAFSMRAGLHQPAGSLNQLSADLGIPFDSLSSADALALARPLRALNFQCLKLLQDNMGQITQSF